jgi:replicative DNA helicase
MIDVGKNYDLDHRYRVEAEICGLIMMSEHHKETLETIFNHNLSVRDFHFEIHKGVYEAILTCIERSAHPSITNVGQFRPEVYRLNNYKEFELTVYEMMRRSIVAPKSLDNAMFILKQYVLMDFWNFNAHDILYGNWNGRDVIHVGENIINEYKAKWEVMTERLKSNDQNDYSNEIRTKVAKHLKGEAIGVSTAVDCLDDFMTGYSPGELIILAGRPGMGKTTFALISAWLTSKKGNPVIFYSLEMPKNQLKSKIISLETNIDYKKIKAGDLTPEELQAVEACNKFIDDSPYFIILDKIKTIEEIARKTEEYVRTKGIKAIFIDYIQRCKSELGKMIPRELITLISRECKSIAKDNYIPVIALSQLSRAVETRQNKRPMLADLKESGSIEEDADIAIFLFRQAYYDSQRPGVVIPYVQLFNTEFIFAKGRDLGTKTIRVFLDPIKMTAEEMSGGSYTSKLPPLPPEPPKTLPSAMTIEMPKPDDNDVPF